jgi:broad specificity phosphatase PhoE
MMRGTTGTRLSPEEIEQARAAARRFRWIESAAATLQRAQELEHASEANEAAKLYERLAGLPR